MTDMVQWLESQYLAAGPARSDRPARRVVIPPKDTASGRALSKTYRGTVLGEPVMVVDGDTRMPLAVHYEWAPVHGWGFLGRGPHQLAYDLLADVLGRPPDPELVQDFMEQRVAFLPRRNWQLPEDGIVAWLHYHEVDA